MATIDIKGTIVPSEDKWIYEYFGMDATSPDDVTNALKDANGEDITLVISSGGGDVISANEIYYALKMYTGNITTDISGWACSASSYIALAGDTVRMTPTAMFMIHNVSGGAMGDYHAMDKESKVLKSFNKAVASAYRIKTGMSETEILNLMDKESWLNCESALEYGFIDEIIGNDEDQMAKTTASAYYNATANVIPPQVIAEFKKKQMQDKINEIHNDVEGTAQEESVENVEVEAVENVVEDVEETPVVEKVDYSANIYNAMIF